MIKYKILILLLLYSLCTFAQQAKDTLAPQLVKKKSTSKLNINRFYIGMDMIKPIASIFDQKNKAASFFIEAPMKNKVWSTINFGYNQSAFANSKLAYTSSTQSISAQVSQVFFPSNYLRDDDNVFAGVGYGLSRTYIGEAQYWIVDQWGSYNGQLPGYSKLFHWIEVNAGFRFMIIRGWNLGWRIEGKSALNPGIFESKVAPQQISLYGRGDKTTSFQYQLCLAKRIKRK